MHARPSCHARPCTQPYSTQRGRAGGPALPADPQALAGGFACRGPHGRPPRWRGNRGAPRGPPEAGRRLRAPAVPAPPQRGERPPLTFPPPLPRPAAPFGGGSAGGSPRPLRKALGFFYFRLVLWSRWPRPPALRKRLPRPRAGPRQLGCGPPVLSAAFPAPSGALGARTGMPGTALSGWC